MSKRVFFGQNDVRYFYFRYKDSVYYSISLLVLTVIVCSLLFKSVIVPQIGKYLSIRQEIIAQRMTIKTINDNIKLLGTIDKAELASDFNIVAKALPPEQDVSGILSAIADAAAKSGVTVNDFKFSLNGEGTGIKTGAKPAYVGVQLVLDANTKSMQQFISEIQQKLPISEVTDIEYSFNSASVDLKFY